jgi:hypothetical protein
MVNTERPDITIEEFLLDLKLVSPQQAKDLVTQSKKTGIAIGKTLILSNLISELNLERLLKLQAIYRNCKIPKQLVLDAYRCCVKEGLTVEQGLAKAGISAQIVSFSRLGLLLVDAKLITKKQLDEAQKLADETRFPLGKTLTMHGAITQEQLIVALDLQKQMRERRLSKDEALAYLSDTKHGADKNIPSGKVAQASEPTTNVDSEQNYSSKNSLVELLVVSGIITEHDADAVFDQYIKTRQKPEQILADYNLVPESLIITAIELQEAVLSGDLNVSAAAETLNYIANYAMNQTHTSN